MSNQDKITQYIDNLSFKKSVFGKVSANDVQEIICDISSMYNEMLSNVYSENERLKRLIDDMDDARPDSEEMSIDPTDEETTEESSDLMKENINSQAEILEQQTAMDVAEDTNLANRDLRKFKRTELLEILLDQSKENERQKKQIEALQLQIADLKGQIEDRTIRMNKAGTIAEAAFLLNGVYDTTQAAAQQYLDGLENLYEREQRNVIEKEARTEAYVKMRIEETDKICAQKNVWLTDAWH